MRDHLICSGIQFLICFLLSTEKFVVLSYNILADYLANDHWRSLYFHIPRNMLSWGWRKSKLVFELSLWSADIMCLQVIVSAISSW